MESLIAYIIHYTPLKERKTFLLNEMNSHSLNYHFIEDFDREKLTDEDLFKFDKTKLRFGTISLFRKQIHAMELIQNSSYNYNLVLEDDIILDKDFKLKLTNGLKQLPDELKRKIMLYIPNMSKTASLIAKAICSQVVWRG